MVRGFAVRTPGTSALGLGPSVIDRTLREGLGLGPVHPFDRFLRSLTPDLRRPRARVLPLDGRQSAFIRTFAASRDLAAATGASRSTG